MVWFVYCWLGWTKEPIKTYINISRINKILSVPTTTHAKIEENKSDVEIALMVTIDCEIGAN